MLLHCEAKGCGVPRGALGVPVSSRPLLHVVSWSFICSTGPEGGEGGGGGRGEGENQAMFTATLKRDLTVDCF